MKKPHKENVIAWVLLVLSIAAAAGFAYAITLVASPIKVTVNSESFTLHCLYHEETVSYSEIETLILSTDYTAKRVKGRGGQAKDFGIYENESLGRHYRLTYTENARNYIICVKKDGSATVFNQKTQEKTESLFAKIQEKIG